MALRPLPLATAGGGCTGCFTTRRTRSKTSSSVIPTRSSSRRWATTSTSNFRCRSPRPTPIGSRSTAATSCRERACFRRAGRRGSTSCSPDSRLAGADHGRMDARPARAGAVAPAGDPRHDAAGGPADPGRARRHHPVAVPGRDGTEATNNYSNMIFRGRGRSVGVPAAADRDGLHGSSLR